MIERTITKYGADLWLVDGLGWGEPMRPAAAIHDILEHTETDTGAGADELQAVGAIMHSRPAQDGLMGSDWWRILGRLYAENPNGINACVDVNFKTKAFYDESMRTTLSRKAGYRGWREASRKPWRPSEFRRWINANRIGIMSLMQMGWISAIERERSTGVQIADTQSLINAFQPMIANAESDGAQRVLVRLNGPYVCVEGVR